MEKIIHQIWVGEYKMPHKEANFCNTIRNTNSDFKYMFWDKVPKLPTPLEKLCDGLVKHKEWVRVADLMRYFIVKEHGGLYIDCDYEQINRLESLNLQEYKGFIPLHYSKGETICNSVFGFEKNHPIIEKVCDNMEYFVEELPWLGPHFFGESIKKYFNQDIEILDVNLDAMLCREGIKTIHSRGEFKVKYLHHHYSYSWHPDNQKKMTKNES
jgi:mannosyltransferase OCH1-like enzyme